MAIQRTYSMIKPDGVRNGHIGEIINRFERAGLKIERMELGMVTPEQAKANYAEHEGTADAQDIAAFREGVELRDGTKCLPARLEPQGPGKSLVYVCEGTYHQVRRMLASRGKPVTYLRRIAEGCVQLGELPIGKTRELTNEELSLLDSVHFDEAEGSGI